jgi:hypothetical protein
MAEEPETLGLGKICRRCGARSATLGGICPACGRAYDPGGLLDRIPFMNNDSYSPLSVRAWVLALLFAAALWLWLVVTDPVAAILLAAAGFIVLVAAIGIANALSDRGR